MPSGPYPVASSEVVYRGHLGRVRVDHVRMPGGETAAREVAEHLDAVAVVPLDAGGDVVLVRQYRHAAGRRLLEIPAGLLDVEAESLEEAARRELAEEAGLGAERLELLTRFHNSAGWSDETTTVYLARGLREVGPPDGFTPEHEEADLEVVRLPLEEALALVRSGELTDAKTIIGLLLVAAPQHAPRRH